MLIQIKNKLNAVLFSIDANSVREAVVAAKKSGADLRSADLRSANLSDANLSDANLSDANLSDANLNFTNLSDANLRSADLRSADLRSANLRGANLRSADLRSADLRSANLRCANLSGANLRGADLSGADLSGADLRIADLWSADLRSANLSHVTLRVKDIQNIVSIRTILPDGDIIGWKKLKNNVICKLQIPASARRVGGVVGRKCRAEYATVLSGEGSSMFNETFKYSKGAKVSPDKFDPNPLVECSGGIHFFLTKKEAEAF